MVFETEGQFQQFQHCKFKDNIVRLLYIPTLEDGNVFLAVNKYGRVGLYEPNRFGLIHTYCLDLSLPMHNGAVGLAHRKPIGNIQPKCGRTHLVIDAVYAPDLQLVMFATTKGILQCYDIGEIEKQSLGLEILPRKEFMNLRLGKSPVTLRNKGHVETHRILELDEVPSCMEYCVKTTMTMTTQLGTEPTGLNNVQVTGNSGSKLLIGDTKGGVTVIVVDTPKFPFLRHRKIRGVLHKIRLSDLRHAGRVKSYKAHNDPVREIRFLTQRQSIISCSRDHKFSLFCEDFTGISDSFIISLPKGVNCLTYSDALWMLATGCDDGVVRIFRQFSMRMPQLELFGHKSSVVAVEMVAVPFSGNPILISFSSDVELRAWDPVTFKCLQNMYLGFPIKSTIMCKTPEFGKRSLIIHQPQYNPPNNLQTPCNDFEPGLQVKRERLSKQFNLDQAHRKSMTPTDTNDAEGDGCIILLYCNSYAKLRIEKNVSNWPFDFENLVTEFQDISLKFEEKIRKKKVTESQDPMLPKLTDSEISEIQNKSQRSKRELMNLKDEIDGRFSSRIYDPSTPTLTLQGTKRLHSFDTKRPYRERMLRRSATMFDKIPFYDIEPPRVNTKTHPE